MKKLLIALIAAATLSFAGCEDPHKDEDGRVVASRIADSEFRLYQGEGLKAQYVIVDEHEYLLITGYRQSGITHSPRCKCIRGF